jgi:4-azaleucine resistance transporter AzlC
VSIFNDIITTIIEENKGGFVMGKKSAEFKLAFSKTFPIFAGIVFLGLSYGIYMNKLGFSFIYPTIMAMTIFAGSMEFVTATLLLQTFNPLNAFILTLVVNARHLFYGVSMLNHYKNMGKKKLFLIFAMCDESFIINFSNKTGENIDRGWFMFFVNLFLYLYWTISSAIGGLIGPYITINTGGIEFVMTALFVVIFIEQWNSKKGHAAALTGFAASTISLLIFGPKYFTIPAMILILIPITLFRNKFIKPREQEVAI